MSSVYSLLIVEFDLANTLCLWPTPGVKVWLCYVAATHKCSAPTETVRKTIQTEVPQQYTDVHGIFDRG